MSYDNADNINVTWIDDDLNKTVHNSKTSYIKHGDCFMHIYDEMGDKARRVSNIEDYEKRILKMYNLEWLQKSYEYDYEQLKQKIEPLDQYYDEDKIYSIRIEVHIKRDYEKEKIQRNIRNNGFY